LGTRAGETLDRLIFVARILAFGGAAGGLANHLLLPPPQGEQRRLWGAVRSVVGGAIVALTVPLFLSLAQSGLVKNVLNAAQDFSSDILILIGFCVVAGFAAQRFIDSLAVKIMRLERQVDDLAEDAEEAVEVSQESYDRSIEAIKRLAPNQRRTNQLIAAGKPWARYLSSVWRSRKHCGQQTCCQCEH
jgi:outer membrane murein-binding lipoprotein Lpp